LFSEFAQHRKCGQRPQAWEDVWLSLHGHLVRDLKKFTLIFKKCDFPKDATWWFQAFFIFTPKLGEDEPILTSIFFKGVETTN